MLLQGGERDETKKKSLLTSDFSKNIVLFFKIKFLFVASLILSSEKFGKNLKKTKNYKYFYSWYKIKKDAQNKKKNTKNNSCCQYSFSFGTVVVAFIRCNQSNLTMVVLDTRQHSNFCVTAQINNFNKNKNNILSEPRHKI